MGLSNTAVPKGYGEFREAVLNGEIPVRALMSENSLIVFIAQI